jgi:hypothetical protein
MFDFPFGFEYLILCDWPMFDFPFGFQYFIEGTFPFRFWVAYQSSSNVSFFVVFPYVNSQLFSFVDSFIMMSEEMMQFV